MSLPCTGLSWGRQHCADGLIDRWWLSSRIMCCHIESTNEPSSQEAVFSYAIAQIVMRRICWYLHIGTKVKIWYAVKGRLRRMTRSPQLLGCRIVQIGGTAAERLAKPWRRARCRRTGPWMEIHDRSLFTWRQNSNGAHTPKFCFVWKSFSLGRSGHWTVRQNLQIS